MRPSSNVLPTLACSEFWPHKDLPKVVQACSWLQLSPCHYRKWTWWKDVTVTYWGWLWVYGPGVRGSGLGSRFVAIGWHLYITSLFTFLPRIPIFLLALTRVCQPDNKTNSSDNSYSCLFLVPLTAIHTFFSFFFFSVFSFRSGNKCQTWSLLIYLSHLSSVLTTKSNVFRGRGSNAMYSACAIWAF